VGFPTVDATGASVSPALLRRVRQDGSTPGPRSARRRRWARWRRALLGRGGLRILAAGVGGAGINLGVAPHTAWWAPLLGLALFGLAVHGRTFRVGTGLGLVFGLAYYLPLLSWTTVYIGGIAMALAVAEGLLLAPVGGLIAAASRRLPAWPMFAAGCWLLGEAVRARFPFGGFPWGGIAFTQADGPLLPAAALLGAPGLALVTALAGFALAAPLRLALLRLAPVRLIPIRPSGRGIPRAGLVRGLVLLVVPFLAGVAGLAAEQHGRGAPTSTVAVIQGNVPEPGLEFNARRRAVLDLHAEQTHQLATDVRAGRAARPTLVIWPENSSDIDPYANPDAAAVITDAARDVGVPILVGAVVGAPGEGDYNMGIVWDPVTGPGATYTKRHPVPFAEYMPARSFFRIFTSWVDRAGFFRPGSTPGNLDVAGVPVGDVICFEVVYDDLVRDVINGGARVLVVQTNNATFGYTAETYQQQAMSRVRAVEFGRTVLIAATSGVSAVIAPNGAVHGRIPLFTPGYLDLAVPLISARTPGTVLGAPLEWTAGAGTALALAGVTLLARRRVHRQRAGVVGRAPAPAVQEEPIQ